VRSERTAELRPKRPDQRIPPDRRAQTTAAASPAAAATAVSATHDTRASGDPSTHLPAPAASIAPGVHCKTPEYPKASRRLTEEGIVSLRFLIDSEGRVLNAEVEKSSGYNRLDEAARQALSLCQFRPGQIDGKPVKSWARINYSWKLK